MIKLTELQNYKIGESLDKSRSVLSQIKQKPRTGKDLERMRTLEAAVQNLEMFLVATN